MGDVETKAQNAGGGVRLLTEAERNRLVRGMELLTEDYIEGTISAERYQREYEPMLQQIIEDCMLRAGGPTAQPVEGTALTTPTAEQP